MTECSQIVLEGKIDYGPTPLALPSNSADDQRDRMANPASSPFPFPVPIRRGVLLSREVLNEDPKCLDRIELYERTSVTRNTRTG